MKKTKRKSYCSFLTVLILFCFQNTLNSQNLNKKYSWSYPIKPHGTLILNNYNCDIEIIHTNSDKIDFELEIIAEGGTENDVSTLESYLNELEFDANSTKVELSTVIYKKKSVNVKTKITLNNNKTVGFSNISKKAYLKIPDYIKLELSTKYSSISIPDLEKLELKSYKDNIEAANIKLSTLIDAKYSDIVFQDISNCKLQLYNCKLEINSAGNININSKYSRCNIGDSEDLTIECYNDKYQFKQTGNIQFNGKYTDFISLNSGDLILDVYKCKFESGEINTFQVNVSKYSSFKFAKASSLNLNDSYNNKFTIGDIGKIEVVKSKYSTYKFTTATNLDLDDSYKDKFNIENVGKIEVDISKYTEYTHNTLKESFLLNEGYKNKIIINKTNEKFRYLDLNGKYDVVKTGVLSDLPLKLDVEAKYGNVNYDPSLFKTKFLVDEGSIYKLYATRTVETDNMPFIKIRGYKMNLSIIDIH